MTIRSRTLVPVPDDPLVHLLTAFNEALFAGLLKKAPRVTCAGGVARSTVALDARSVRTTLSQAPGALLYEVDGLRWAAPATFDDFRACVLAQVQAREDAGLVQH